MTIETPPNWPPTAVSQSEADPILPPTPNHTFDIILLSISILIILSLTWGIQGGAFIAELFVIILGATWNPIWEFVATVIQGLLLLVPLSLLAWRRSVPRYRAVYQTWAWAALFSLFMLPLPFIDNLRLDLTGYAQIVSTAVFLFIFHTATQKKFVEPSLGLWPGLLLAPLLGLGWLAWGTLGSIGDFAVNLTAGLLFGLTAAWLFARILFTAVQQTSDQSGWNFWFGGLTASVTLTIMGSTFGNNGQEILLMAMFLVLGWVVYAFGQWGRQGNSPATSWLSMALFIGLMTAWPLLMVDPSEMLLIIMGDPLGSSVWAAVRVTFALVGGTAIALAFGHARLPKFPNMGWPIVRTTVSAWLIAIVVFWFVSIPGFHGDTLFVIFKEQADLSGAQAISDPLDRRQFVYETLVDHADSSQASLREALDARFIAYQPYYLVNAMEVKGGTYMRNWLSNQPEVDRVLSNPYLRPTPELMGETRGTAVAPTSPDWNLTILGADRVWRELGVRGAGIIIGQSDSGVDWTHPELQDSYRGREGNHDYNWLDPWYGDPEPRDQGGHGTHTLGSVLGNNVGVAPDAEWFACANLQRNLGNPAYYLDCMQFMLAPFPANGNPLTNGRPELGAHILNNSWGCPGFEGCDPLTFQSGVAALRDAGVFVVVSAGNDGLIGCETVSSPLAVYDEVFTVGAHNSAGFVTEFSSRGPVTVDGSNRVKPDILAPGAEVLSAYPGGTYEYADGTSMAGPHVAGVVALMWSANPALIGEIEQTAQILRETAQPYTGTIDCGDSNVIPNNTAGYGLVDAFTAVERALRERE